MSNFDIISLKLCQSRSTSSCFFSKQLKNVSKQLLKCKKQNINKPIFHYIFLKTEMCINKPELIYSSAQCSVSQRLFTKVRNFKHWSVHIWAVFDHSFLSQAYPAHGGEAITSQKTSLISFIYPTNAVYWFIGSYYQESLPIL